jgi:hypothetical protein
LTSITRAADDFQQFYLTWHQRKLTASHKVAICELGKSAASLRWLLIIMMMKKIESDNACVCCFDQSNCMEAIISNSQTSAIWRTSIEMKTSGSTFFGESKLILKKKLTRRSPQKQAFS